MKALSLCHYFYFRAHSVCWDDLSRHRGSWAKGKTYFPGESFIEQIFKNQCPFALQGFPPASSSDSEEHWIIGSSSKLRRSRVALFVPGKACRADGTCWELQALADNYQISSVLSSSWVWDYWLNLEWPLHNGHDEQSCSWAPGQWDWADPFQEQTVL